MKKCNINRFLLGRRIKKSFALSLAVIFLLSAFLGILPPVTAGAVDSEGVWPMNERPMNLMVGYYMSETGTGEDIDYNMSEPGVPYAYVADGLGGLKIFDISDKTAPVLVTTLPALDSVDRVSVVDDIAYVIDGIYLRAVNISDRSTPVILDEVKIGKGVDLYAFTDGLVYVIDGIPAVRAFRLENSELAEKGVLNSAMIGSITKGAVEAAENHGKFTAYLYDGELLHVADVTLDGNKTNVQSFRIAGTMDVYRDVNGIYASDKIVYLTTKTNLMAVDFTDPTAPVVKFDYAIPRYTGQLNGDVYQPTAVVVSGKRAFVGGTYWMHELDISGQEPVVVRRSFTYKGVAEWYQTNPCNAIAFDGQYALLTNDYLDLTILDMNLGLESPDGAYEGYSYRDHTEKPASVDLSPETPSSIPAIQEVAETKVTADGAPALYRVSDAIKPGELLTVYGENLKADTKLAFQKITDSVSPADVPSKEQQNAAIPVVQNDEAAGQNATIVFPEDMAAGSYYVWASNDKGWSNPVVLNGARLQWVSQDKAAAGLLVKAVGMNFAGTEFGADDDAKVMLVNRKADVAYLAPISKAEPYALTFVIPNIPADKYGAYEVLVSNNGGKTWSTSEDGRSLTITAPVADPIGLGVTWADKFNWTEEFDVTTYGATGNDTTDDTAAFETALLAAGAASKDGQTGGIVYIPNGTYIISRGLKLPEGVVLRGESQNGTIVTYHNSDKSVTGGVVIAAKDGSAGSKGRIGVADFTMKVHPDSVYDHVLWFGPDWSSTLNGDMDSRQAEYMFVLNMNLETSFNRLPKGRSAASIILGKGHVIVRGSNLKGYNTTFSSGYIGEYAEYSHNDFITYQGNITTMAQYAVIEDNYISRQPMRVTNDNENWAQGIFIRGKAYVAGNEIKNLGEPGVNEGEIICVEHYQGGSKMMGQVLSAEGKTITVEPRMENGKIYGEAKHTNWGMKRFFGLWYILITEGHGAGQQRQVTSLNEADKSVTISQAWDIMPDNTSKFVIYNSIPSVVVYNNKAYDCGASFMFYGDTYDSIMADNYGKNTEGARVYAKSVGNGLVFSWFARVERNVFEGGGTEGHTCGIGAFSGLEVKDPFAIPAYGIAIKNNSLSNLWDPRYVKTQQTGCGLSGVSLVTEERLLDTLPGNLIKAAIIENNHVRNADYGLVIGYGAGLEYYTQFSWQKARIDDTIVKGNTFENVQTNVHSLQSAGNDVTFLGGEPSQETNMAFRQRVTGKNDAENAVDGNADTVWCAADAQDALTIDLGTINEIGSIDLDWKAAPSTFTVQKADTNDANTQWTSVDLEAPTSARYIRLINAQGGKLSEIKINGLIAPRPVSARTDAMGNRITIDFDRFLASSGDEAPHGGSPVDKNGFRVAVNGAAVSVEKAELAAGRKSVVLVLASGVDVDDTIVVSYVPGKVLGQNGGKLASFSQKVANLVPFPEEKQEIPAGTNLIRNPGFEFGIFAWEEYANKNVVIDGDKNPSDIHSGAHAMQVTNRTVAWGGPRQDVRAQLAASGAGKYRMSAWFKNVSATSAPLRIQLEYKYKVDEVTTTKNVYATVTQNSTNTSYTQVSHIFDLEWPGELTFAKIEINANNGLDAFYVDDVEFVKVVDTPSGSAEIEEIGGTGQLGNKGAKGVALVGSYAYVANETSVQIVDVSNPRSPQISGSIATGITEKIAAKGNTIFFGDAAAGVNKLYAYDVTDPMNPVKLTEIKVNNPQEFQVVGDLLYVFDGGAGVRIVDISDPANMRQLSVITPGGATGYVSDDILYMTARKDGMQYFNIYNVKDPSAPALVSTTLLEQNADYKSLTKVGSYVYIGDGRVNNSKLLIYDVSKPNKPVYKSSYSTVNGPEYMTVKDGYIYVCYYANKFEVLDVTDKIAPIPAAALTVTEIDTQMFDMALDGEYVYIANRTNGLKIIKVTLPESGPTVTSIEVSYDNIEVMPGKTQSVVATVYDENHEIMTGVPVIWSSDDEKIAKVADGRIIGIGEGETVIWAMVQNMPGIRARVLVKVQRALSADATIKELYVNGTLIPGFKAEITDYDVILPEGTKEIPIITYILSDERATAVVTSPVNLLEPSIITVTAEDGMTVKTYKVSFKLEDGNHTNDEPDDGKSKDNGSSTGDTNSTDEVNRPKTGDNMSLALVMSAALIAAAGIIVCIYGSKKNKKIWMKN